MIPRFIRTCATPAQTSALGWQLGARCVAPGNAVLLFGYESLPTVHDNVLFHVSALPCSPVGAGKTCFAGGFVRGALYAMGVAGAAGLVIPSPSFNLMISYGPATGVRVHHIDAYRLADEASATALNLQGLFQSSVVLLEWPERVRALWPSATIDVAIDFCETSVEDSSTTETDGESGAAWVDLDAPALARQVTISASGPPTGISAKILDTMFTVS